MSNKRGRPDGKKYPVEYRLRMTEDQWEILLDRANKKGITIAEYMRSLIIDAFTRDTLKGENDADKCNDS